MQVKTTQQPADQTRRLEEYEARLRRLEEDLQHIAAVLRSILNTTDDDVLDRCLRRS
ncbi:MAG: hypothetical protein HXY34_07545 [Candidatus Thorarchaeota archaeon]|nr:hypothetical protein [Candidatus Thorarchaeota archaeon]